MPLTSNWEILTSVSIPGGYFMRAVAVSRGGAVFYTDGNSLKYFLDDCSAIDENCLKTGEDLLPPSKRARGISALVLTKDFFASPTTTGRYLYASSITTHSIYRFPILYKQGAVDVEGTRKLLSFSTGAMFNNEQTLVVGNGMAQGFADGDLLTQARLNVPSELEISSDGRFLIISDFLNNRIRIADFQTNRLSTLLGNGQLRWNGGVPCADADVCASVYSPIGVGISPDDASLFIVMNSENAVGRLSYPFSANLSDKQFGFTCQLKVSMRYNAEETCNVNMPNARSCMLYKPLDVIVSKSNEIYVSVTQGITKINLNNQKCQQVRPPPNL
jgi:hypothetical protein